MQLTIAGSLMSIPPEIAELLEGLLYGLAIGFGGAAVIGGFLKLRRSFHTWRYRRALARNPDMLLEEEREHLWRIDEAEYPPMLSAERVGAFVWQLAPFFLGIAALWTLLGMGYRPDSNLVLMFSAFGFMGAAWLVALWKKLNDPQEDALSAEEGARFVEAPTDAIHGALAAGGILLILALLWWFKP